MRKISFYNSDYQQAGKEGIYTPGRFITGAACCSQLKLNEIVTYGSALVFKSTAN